MMIVEGVINFSLSSCPTRARTGTHVSLAHLFLGQAKPPRRVRRFPWAAGDSWVSRWFLGWRRTQNHKWTGIHPPTSVSAGKTKNEKEMRTWYLLHATPPFRKYLQFTATYRYSYWYAIHSRFTKPVKEPKSGDHR